MLLGFFVPFEPMAGVGVVGLEARMQPQGMKRRLVITTTQVRRNLNSVLQQIQRKREPAVIEKSGLPVAVMLSVSEYENLLRYKKLATFDKLTREIGKEYEHSEVDEDELLRELNETKRQITREKYARIA